MVARHCACTETPLSIPSGKQDRRDVLVEQLVASLLPHDSHVVLKSSRDSAELTTHGGLTGTRLPRRGAV